MAGREEGKKSQVEPYVVGNTHNLVWFREQRNGHHVTPV